MNLKIILLFVVILHSELYVTNNLWEISFGIRHAFCPVQSLIFEFLKALFIQVILYKTDVIIGFNVSALLTRI